MRAVVCHGPGDYRLESVPEPKPPDDGAVIRVEAVGICASDVKCFQGAPMFWGDATRPRYCEPPVVPGHELVGRVAEIDAGAASRWGVQAGDRVVAEQIVPCGECRYCQRGQYWLCRRNDVFGFHQRTQGAMAEYMAVPPLSRVHRIDGDLPAAHAAFAEPLSCALHAVERGDVGFDDVVVVAGVGPIGMGMVAGAKLRHPRSLVAVDNNPARLELAKTCGADLVVDVSHEDPVSIVLELTEGYGCDVYFDATGHPSGVAQGLSMLRKAGRFVEYSVMREPATVDWTVIGDSKELDVRGAHLGPYCWPPAIDLLERGELPMDQIVTHQLGIEDFEEGLKLVADGRTSVKVSLVGF
ncbi:MAG TPA: alcohol dehydrogenase catalytic domain-containing protein [Acidimicrobiales bacterium]|nr:alcohol dehydrogenase catalytic domain-containing protein [Acidimicrobiales bacterium]